MLIRVSGGHDGIKEYLEHGQKSGRDYSRDELDQRLMLAGNLELANDIIQGMNNDGDKYLHITLSFKEDQVDDDLLKTITEEFRQFTLNAFDDDEYHLYAEAHLPKIKSYINRKTGEDIERKPHIHIVIPKINLLSHQHLNPFGDYRKTTDYFKAFQEDVNQRYSLASPAENRRDDFTSLADIISRYKGDNFGGKSREVKSLLHKMIEDKNIVSWSDFKDAVASFGQVKIRNEGRVNEYLNITLPGAAKGINLREAVFSREAIEKTGVSQDWIAEKKALWKDVFSHEVKHIVKASEKVRKHYYALTDNEKKSFLISRRAYFESKFREAKHERYEQSDVRRTIRGDISGGRPERTERVSPRNLHHSRAVRGVQQRHTPDVTGRTPATGAPGLRHLPKLSLVRQERRGVLLLPRNDAAVLEKPGAGRHLPVRRGVPGVGQKKNPLRQPRSQLPKKSREPLMPLAAVPVLSRMKAGKITLAQSVPVKQTNAARHKTPLRSLSVRYRGHSVTLRELNRTVTPAPVAVVVASARPALSYRAHSVVSAMATGQGELRREQEQKKLTWFKEVRLELDATRLLNRLSQTHGLQSGRFQVVAGRDGSDRIICEKRHYNVSDFLTKEMNIPWKEASRILSTVYKEQQREEPRDTPRHARHSALWEAHKAQYQERRAALWKARLTEEKSRREALNTRLKDELSRIKTLPKDKRTAARSVARMSHVARQVSLRDTLSRERTELKAQLASPSHHYRDYLVSEASEGNRDALAELRRQRIQEPVPDRLTLSGKDDSPGLHEMLSYRVEKNGDVTYQADGQTLFTDRGQSVSFTDKQASGFDREQIELGLRLSLAKFGGVLALSGTDEFKAAVIDAAAISGLKIDFKDEALNARLAELSEAVRLGKAAFRQAEQENQVPAQQTPDQTSVNPLEQPASPGINIDIEIDIEPTD